MLIKRGDAWIETDQLQSGDTVDTESHPSGPGLWLRWCGVDGYSAARCSCTTGWTWFRNWSDATKAADARHA